MLFRSRVRGINSCRVRGSNTSRVRGINSCRVRGSNTSIVRGINSCRVRGSNTSRVRGNNTSRVRGSNVRPRLISFPEEVVKLKVNLEQLTGDYRGNLRPDQLI